MRGGGEPTPFAELVIDIVLFENQCPPHKLEGVGHKTRKAEREVHENRYKTLKSPRSVYPEHSVFGLYAYYLVSGKPTTFGPANCHPRSGHVVCERNSGTLAQGFSTVQQNREQVEDHSE